MGTRSAQPAPEEGTQAPHRQAPEQVRRRLTGEAGAASGFHARRASRDASIFRRWFKRGGEFAPRTSRSACSLPLSRIRASVSSCHVISTPPSIGTDSSVGFASWRGRVCCRLCTPKPPSIWRFAPSVRRTRRVWRGWRPTSPRSSDEWRRSRPQRLRDRSDRCGAFWSSSCAATRWRSHRYCPLRAAIIQAARPTRSKRSSATARCAVRGWRRGGSPVVIRSVPAATTRFHSHSTVETLHG